MKEWKDDKALFALIKEELYTAVVGDIMDKMGYTRQFLPPRIRPLRDDMLVAGRAMTVLEADVLDAGKEKGVNPVLKRSLCPGPGAAWKGDRLPCADRNGGRTDQ